MRRVRPQREASARRSARRAQALSGGRASVPRPAPAPPKQCLVQRRSPALPRSSAQRPERRRSLHASYRMDNNQRKQAAGRKGLPRVPPPPQVSRRSIRRCAGGVDVTRRSSHLRRSTQATDLGLVDTAQTLSPLPGWGRRQVTSLTGGDPQQKVVVPQLPPRGARDPSRRHAERAKFRRTPCQVSPLHGDMRLVSRKDIRSNILEWP